MGEYKLMPSRSGNTPTIVADLDALIEKSIAFKFQGKAYIVKPVKTKTYLEVAQALGDLQTLVSREDKSTINRQEIDQTYFNLLSTLCDELTLEDVQSMTVAQINALISLIVRHVTGNTEPLTRSDEKKNPLS